jgi:hypothetical protein
VIVFVGLLYAGMNPIWGLGLGFDFDSQASRGTFAFQFSLVADNENIVCHGAVDLYGVFGTVHITKTL